MFHPKRNHNFGNTSAAITTANNRAGSSRHKVKRKKPWAGQSLLSLVSVYMCLFFFKTLDTKDPGSSGDLTEGNCGNWEVQTEISFIFTVKLCASDLPHPDLWITSSGYRDKATIQKYLPKENFVIGKHASSPQSLALFGATAKCFT